MARFVGPVLPGFRTAVANPRAWGARHPEWRVLALGLLAWLVVALPTSRAFIPPICSQAGLVGMSLARLQASRPTELLASELWGWALMCMAMMLPLTVLSVRHVAFRSFAFRRERAIAGYVFGYLAVWLAAGLVLEPLALVARILDRGGGARVGAAVLVFAAAWQFTSWKLAALRRCHRTGPLAPTGWPADLDCLRYGATSGGNCVLNCWPLMLALATTMHGLLAMALALALLLAERYQPRPRPGRHALLLVGAAIVLAI